MKKCVFLFAVSIWQHTAWATHFKCQVVSRNSHNECMLSKFHTETQQPKIWTAPRPEIWTAHEIAVLVTGESIYVTLSEEHRSLTQDYSLIVSLSTKNSSDEKSFIALGSSRVTTKSLPSQILLEGSIPFLENDISIEFQCESTSLPHF